MTVQNAISTLATDNGVTAAIAGTTTVQVYDEANGTTIYSVNVSGSKTGSSGNTFMFNLTISVDQNGNPTTVPSDDNSFGGGFFGSLFGGFQGDSAFGGFGFFGRRRR
jgi:endoglucanase Acf2